MAGLTRVPVNKIKMPAGRIKVSVKTIPVRVHVLLMLLGVGLVLPALLASWIAPHDPQAINLFDSLAVPSKEHWMGLDEQGADILSRLLFGARISLWVGLVSVLISCSVGVTLGIVAALRRGWVEQSIMRLVDVLLAFPGLLLAIALAAVLGPGIGNVVFALSVLGWTGFARLARAQTLVLRQSEYVEAACIVGVSTARLIRMHIIPNMMAPILVQASFAVAASILAEASLSFLGLGAPVGTPSWGAMLSEGKHVLSEAPHVSIFPGLAIMFTVLGFNMLGDVLSDWLDPKRRYVNLQRRNT